jgi:hypothetical protein
MAHLYTRPIPNADLRNLEKYKEGFLLSCVAVDVLTLKMEGV